MSSYDDSIGHRAGQQIFRSSDGGGSWVELSRQADVSDWTATQMYSQGAYDMSLGVSPSDVNTVFWGGVMMFLSRDGGAS